VLALLDNRITSQRYGQVFFDTLPDYSFTTNFMPWKVFDVEVSVEHTFAAAHFLRNYHGSRGRLHGHNYRFMVGLPGRTG